MISHATVSDLKRHFEAIRGIEAGRLSKIREVAVPFHLDRGDTAFDTGSPCSMFVMLTQGRIKVAKPALSGREILLYRVEPGQTCVLTLSCLLESTPYPARGTASHECFGAALPRPFFLQLVDESIEIRNMVLRSLSSRVVELMGLVEEVAFNRLDQRLARTLTAQARSESGVVLQRTHQQLADELGSVREIVSRILGSFADEGLVRLERGRVHVLDTEGLRRIQHDT